MCCCPNPPSQQRTNRPPPARIRVNVQSSSRFRTPSNDCSTWAGARLYPFVAFLISGCLHSLKVQCVQVLLPVQQQTYCPLFSESFTVTAMSLVSGQQNQEKKWKKDEKIGEKDGKGAFCKTNQWPSRYLGLLTALRRNNSHIDIQPARPAHNPLQLYKLSLLSTWAKQLHTLVVVLPLPHSANLQKGRPAVLSSKLARKTASATARWCSWLRALAVGKNMTPALNPKQPHRAFSFLKPPFLYASKYYIYIYIAQYASAAQVLFQPICFQVLKAIHVQNANFIWVIFCTQLQGLVHFVHYALK